MNNEEQKEYQERMGSPEMEYLQYLSEQTPTQPYNKRDHSHCWAQDNPPCGVKGKHRCCLCEEPVPTQPDWIVKEVESRWHNWREDPDFWKKDIIDVFQSVADTSYEAGYEEAKKLVETVVKADGEEIAILKKDAVDTFRKMVLKTLEDYICLEPAEQKNFDELIERVKEL